MSKQFDGINLRWIYHSNVLNNIYSFLPRTNNKNWELRNWYIMDFLILFSRLKKNMIILNKKTVEFQINWSEWKANNGNFIKKSLQGVKYCMQDHWYPDKTTFDVLVLLLVKRPLHHTTTTTRTTTNMCLHLKQF